MAWENKVAFSCAHASQTISMPKRAKTLGVTSKESYTHHKFDNREPRPKSRRNGTHRSLDPFVGRVSPTAIEGRRW